jgi:2-oxoglutarate dehydrogenase E2 component (dihydrolipoamide succinyltransferase)
MATDVIMPQMGESIAEGTITKWLVNVGDAVERDQPLLEISTDKVDAEIPSPASGVLLEVKFQEGVTVSVNELIAVIGEAEEAVADKVDEDAESGGEPSDEDADASAEAPEEESAQSAGDEAEAASPAADSETPDVVVEEDEEDAAGAAEADRIRRFSSPVVRKIAAAEGVDLTQLQGTGLRGRVTKHDILKYLEEREAMPVEVDASATAASEGDPELTAPVLRALEVMPTSSRPSEGFFVAPFSEGDDVEIEPMSKIRQITAAHMSYSKATSAHVSTVFEMDLTRVARLRNRAKSGFAKEHKTKLTYMPFIFKAVASALIANPKLNAAIDGTNIVYKKDINLGVAVALDWGLLVPVVRHADQLSLVGLAKAANDLAERARSKKLSPDEVQKGTFTITNPGVFGSLFGTPIINQPQVAILGIGTIEKRPVVKTDPFGNDSIAIRMMSHFAITYDHRLVDGADADRFMVAIKRTLAEETWSELDPFL